MSSRIDKVANMAIIFASLLVAASIGRREFSRRDASPLATLDASGPPVYVPDWKQLLPAGLNLGPSTGPVQLMMFSDLECPFCARFHLEVLTALNKKYEGKINTTFVHLPIKAHRFAMQSALALECAAAQDRQTAFLDVVYRKQDSIGLKPWREYAREARVRDTTAFLKCLTLPPPDRIDAGKQWGSRLELSFTPTVIVNGWRFPNTPDEESLSEVIDAILAGKSPPSHTSGITP